MNHTESERLKRIGAGYIFLVLGLAILLPLILSFAVCAYNEAIRVDSILLISLVFGIFIWIALVMSIGWGSFSKPFMKKAMREVSSLPYQFDSSFKGRGGVLYIDVQHGMIGFISAYNPFQVQIFSASRLDRMGTLASSMSGIRFIFYIDHKKISMPTLLSNRMVSPTSQMGAEAVSKADRFVELLKMAKQNADAGI